jgi:formylglycine-generating enzyme
MNCVTWYEAMAFCAWDGGYLPTEAEWNYAAAGGDEQRALPWSSPPGSLSMLDLSRASWDCLANGMPGCQVTDLTEVAGKPAGDGRWGQSELAGNVYNWTLDWYGPYQSTCTDCANLVAAPDGPGGTTIRVVRGGGFDNGASALRTNYRNGYVPEHRTSNIGVRCAR